MALGSPSTRPWTSGPAAPSGVGAGTTYHGRGRAGGENGYRRPGRRSRKHPPDRRAYAFASSIPDRAPRAPIHHDDRPRADLSVAAIGREVCRRTSVSTMAATKGHHHGESRPARRARCASRPRQLSTRTTLRVRTDAAAPAERRRPRRVRHRPRGARGSGATRGRRPTPQEHSRTETDRCPPALRTGRDRQGFDRAAPPASPGSG